MIDQLLDLGGMHSDITRLFDHATDLMRRSSTANSQAAALHDHLARLNERSNDMLRNARQAIERSHAIEHPQRPQPLQSIPHWDFLA